MNPPRSKLRESTLFFILAKIFNSCRHNVTVCILFNPLLLYVLPNRFFHFLVALLYLHNIHLSKIPLPIVASSFRALCKYLSRGKYFLLLVCPLHYSSGLTGLENVHDLYLTNFYKLNFVPLLYFQTVSFNTSSTSSPNTTFRNFARHTKWYINIEILSLFRHVSLILLSYCFSQQAAGNALL